MKALFLLPLLLAAAQAAPERHPLPVHVGGRVVAEGAALRFGWPGVYIEGRFRGTAVTAEVENAAEPLRVLIDGKSAGTIAAGAGRFAAAGLVAGEHRIRLEKVTESQSGSVRFLGFFTPGTPLPPQARARGIEFVGDSYTVGYGNTSPRHDCGATGVHDTTDTQQSFGPQLARRLGADYRVVAYSGYGIVRNYNGNKPGESLPFLYPRAIPGEAEPAASDAGWHPQAIVINLGTNDFSTPLHAGEAWADDAALRAAYRTRYIGFVRELQARQPQARFVLMGSDRFIADVRAVAVATGATAVQFGPLELTGCDWHPSVKDDTAMADLLEPLVRPLL
jgi:lysophospholipase L1-like esterase